MLGESVKEKFSKSFQNFLWEAKDLGSYIKVWVVFSVTAHSIFGRQITSCFHDGWDSIKGLSNRDLHFSRSRELRGIRTCSEIHNL